MFQVRGDDLRLAHLPPAAVFSEERGENSQETLRLTGTTQPDPRFEETMLDELNVLWRLQAVTQNSKHPDD